MDTHDDSSKTSNGEPRDDEGRRHHHRRWHHRHGRRKERVLHTRISEALADDIRRLADDLRVPASNLVRNVLEEVFTMVESVSDDVGELFENVLDEAEEARERVRRRSARRRERGFASGSGERDARTSGDRETRPGGEREAASGSAEPRRQPTSRFEDQVECELRHDEARESAPTPPAPTAPAAPATPSAPAAPAAPAAAGAPRDLPPAIADVLGWQPLVLNHDRSCAGCGVALRRGAHAYIGLGRQGLTDTTVCRACAGTLD